MTTTRKKRVTASIRREGIGRQNFVEHLSLLFVVISAAVLAPIAPSATTTGLVLGGLLATLNFTLLRRLISALVRRQRPIRQALLAVFLVAKFLLLAVALYLLIRYLPVDGLGLILGVSVVVIAILAEAIRATLRPPQHQLTNQR